jgi:hypothetical protein
MKHGRAGPQVKNAKFTKEQIEALTNRIQVPLTQAKQAKARYTESAVWRGRSRKG